MTWLALPALAAAAYYLLALIAAAKWRRLAARQAEGPHLPISVLKPIRGRDPAFYEAIRSHAQQDYPEFELIFGTGDSDDPAIQDIERLRREFPAVPISLHVVATDAPNAKAGVLAELPWTARRVLCASSGETRW